MRNIALVCPSWRDYLWGQVSLCRERELLLSQYLSGAFIAPHLDLDEAYEACTSFLRSEGGDYEAVLMQDDDLAFFVADVEGKIDRMQSAIDRCFVRPMGKLLSDGYRDDRLVYAAVPMRGGRMNEECDATGKPIRGGSALMFITDGVWQRAKAAGFTWRQKQKDFALCDAVRSQGVEIYRARHIVTWHRDEMRDPLIKVTP